MEQCWNLRWQEQGEGVERHQAASIYKHVSVGLPILASLINISLVKVFADGGLLVEEKTSLDTDPIFGREKVCGGGPVKRHEPADDTGNERGNSLSKSSISLNSHAHTVSSHRITHKMKIHAHP